MQTKIFNSRKLIRLAVAGIAVLAVSACAPRVATRGNLPDPDLLANIEVGQVNKRGVVELIGSPSSVAPFKGESWYYISERTETRAFFEPDVIERKVIIIRFDKKGMVSEIKALGLKDGHDIAMVGRVTPTAGKEITLLQQLFGNIGRFESDVNPTEGIGK
ncbi:MAG: outer membrane protein assembly factor BamE [Rhodospirillaceae bacterium]|jgi:outer membrane protein assembly factor BamE (lipoprotein component of BamABCDE complex)|nr:outer membrane protein assembly factor BamE [Rhodospirillaceae bacterium]